MKVHLRVRLMHRVPQRKKERRELRTALSQGIGLRHLLVSAWRCGMCCVSDSNPLTAILGSVCIMQYDALFYIQEANLKFCTCICVYADYFFY